MKKKNVFNLVIGILVILQSIFLTKVFAISVSLFVLGILNLFIGLGGLDSIVDRNNKKKFDDKNPF